MCQSLLERPRSTDASGVTRRKTVRERNVEFNEQLAEVCAMYIHCRFDQNAVFSDPFQAEDVSRRDYFHPSLRGQQRLAVVTWSASFDFSDLTPPVTSASTAVVEGGVLVSVEATDNVGVAGIEYRLNLSAFKRYAGPLLLAAGSNIRFRAVDANGNTEATWSIAA